MAANVSRLFRIIRDHLGLNVQGIHPRIARRIYIAGATVRNCNGACCRGGTTVSLQERENILAHARIVGDAMTSRARRNPSRWFWKRRMWDDDFTAGRVTYTRVLDGACVFYREDGLCALQVASENRLSSPYKLKPSVCLLWPLTIRDNTLEPGYQDFTRRRECCAPVRNGRRTLLQVLVPDEKLISAMARPGNSRGGGSSKG